MPGSLASTTVPGYGEQVGEVITIFGSPEGEEVFPEENLTTIVHGVEENQQVKLEIQGVLAMNVQIDRAGFTSLENDSAVLGVDVTPALAFEDLVGKTQIDPSTIQVIPGPFYWAVLEE